MIIGFSLIKRVSSPPPTSMPVAPPPVELSLPETVTDQRPLLEQALKKLQEARQRLGAVKLELNSMKKTLPERLTTQERVDIYESEVQSLTFETEKLLDQITQPDLIQKVQQARVSVETVRTETAQRKTEVESIVAETRQRLAELVERTERLINEKLDGNNLVIEEVAEFDPLIRSLEEVTKIDPEALVFGNPAGELLEFLREAKRMMLESQIQERKLARVEESTGIQEEIEDQVQEEAQEEIEEAGEAEKSSTTERTWEEIQQEGKERQKLFQSLLGIELEDTYIELWVSQNVPVPVTEITDMYRGWFGKIRIRNPLQVRKNIQAVRKAFVAISYLVAQGYEVVEVIEDQGLDFPEDGTEVAVVEDLWGTKYYFPNYEKFGPGDEIVVRSGEVEIRKGGDGGG